MGHASTGVAEDDALTELAHARGATFGEPLVEAKLAAPYLRSAVLPREALLQRLLRADTGLVTMVAPPGYGKSTSLALWRAQEPRPVAWVTCDAADADPIRFLGYVGLAIERALDLGMPVLDRRSVNGASALTNAVPRLTSALHEAGRPLVLLLDDVHHLGGTPTSDVLAMVIDYLPPDVTVAAAGRTDAGLPLARLRASGRLVEIGIDDLALDEHEAGRLAALGGRPLAQPEARDLHARTEGWPAAVYLAARRPHRQSSGRTTATPSVSGRDTDIGDYIEAELLDTASPSVRAFLQKTAILDRMNAGLCDAVVEGTSSDRILRDLASTNQLVVPLDAQGGWFRYHTLLREHLLATLERDRDAANRLHRRAAEWFAANGLPELAVDHLFAAGDPDAAAAVACAIVPRLFREGREATFARWLGGLDDDTIRRQPFLAVLAAWMYTLQGRTSEAERMADLTVGAEYEGARPAGADLYEEARATLWALQSRQGLAPAIEHARHALDRSTLLSAWRPQSLAALGAILTIADDRDEGEALLREAAIAAQAIGGWRAQVFADAWRALSAIERDDWATADTLSRRTADSSARGQFDPTAIAAARSVVAARVAAHRGELAEARRQMAAFQLGRTTLGTATSWISVRCLLEAARTHLALADPAGARSCLQQAGDILIRRPHLGRLGAEVAELRDRIRSLPPGPGGTSTLTPAEVRVLRLLPTYLTAAEMAERLYVTPNTVRTQIQALYGKLGATSRAEAVEAAIEIGLLEPLPVLAEGRITSS
ncbi:MAG TPA: LuxR C-terminal-related transcriptional regulator [Candidatus Limnocylindrales bacterium]